MLDRPVSTLPNGFASFSADRSTISRPVIPERRVPAPSCPWGLPRPGARTCRSRRAGAPARRLPSRIAAQPGGGRPPAGGARSFCISLCRQPRTGRAALGLGRGDPWFGGVVGEHRCLRLVPPPPRSCIGRRDSIVSGGVRSLTPFFNVYGTLTLVAARPTRFISSGASGSCRIGSSGTSSSRSARCCRRSAAPSAGSASRRALHQRAARCGLDVYRVRACDHASPAVKK